jgi:hypothetical protein
MLAQRLADLEGDGEARIEARHRFLEDHGDILADDPAALLGGYAAQVVAVELHPVGRDRRRPGQEAHQRQHGHRLAGAGFADDRQDFALVDGKIGSVDGPKWPGGGLERDGEIADFEKGHDFFRSPVYIGVER